MKDLKVLWVLNSSGRTSSVDIFRGIAILSVVIYHFNHKLPYGYLGVDLFFVVSGLLVGGLLTKEFKKGAKINFFKFILQRGFKIWPSYYIFLLFGSLLAYIFYRDSNPEQLIPFWDLKRYLFFYQNYTGFPIHWSFDHVWSLCVEEHFYILLPILFLIVNFFIGEKYKIKSLFLFVILTILVGIAFKHFSYFFTNSKDTFSATHNRIDALAWGVLLNLILLYSGEKLKNKKLSITAFSTGLLLFIGALFIHIKYDHDLFERIYFHSIIPVSFFLMLAGLYYIDFSKHKILRFIAYYSYNWYLWHPVFVIILTKVLGNNFLGLLSYLIITFFMAMIATIFVEEPVLERRKAILDKLFYKKRRVGKLLVK